MNLTNILLIVAASIVALFSFGFAFRSSKEKEGGGNGDGGGKNGLGPGTPIHNHRFRINIGQSPGKSEWMEKRNGWWNDGNDWIYIPDFWDTKKHIHTCGDLGVAFYRDLYVAIYWPKVFGRDYGLKTLYNIFPQLLVKMGDGCGGGGVEEEIIKSGTFDWTPPRTK